MEEIDEKTYCHAVLCTGNESRAKLRARIAHGEQWKAIYRTVAEKQREISDPTILWNRLLSLGIRFSNPNEPDYPPSLREIPDPPLGIYLRGKWPPSDACIIGIVGTRRTTPAGATTARNFASTLASRSRPEKFRECRR